MKKKTKITKVDTLHSISEYKLSNGLRVLLYPVADFAGIVGTCIVYHVGSRNEKSGYTGATHLLEHLLFKESKHFRKKDKNTIFELLEKRGVMINATTSFDRTDYFAVLPTKLLTLALTIEADRMRNAILKPEHLASEMPVVQSELEWRDGRPIATLSQEIWSTAFQAHPYHHPIIGWRSDVESVTVDKLKHFYNDFYHPNNATLILVGDLNEKKTLKQVTELFGDIPPSIKPIDFSVVQEPSQRGSRHVEIRKPGENWVSVCYKNPNALHADMPALIVLGLCLSSGRTSRLYKAFFDKGLAVEVYAGPSELLDEGLFEIAVQTTNTLTHAKAEELIRSVVEEVIANGVSKSELKAVASTARFASAQRRDSVMSLMDGLSEEVARGSWKRFYTLIPDILKVTSSDVQRVAKKYFNDSQKTTGYFIHTT